MDTISLARIPEVPFFEKTTQFRWFCFLLQKCTFGFHFRRMVSIKKCGQKVKSRPNYLVILKAHHRWLLRNSKEQKEWAIKSCVFRGVVQSLVVSNQKSPKKKVLKNNSAPGSNIACHFMQKKAAILSPAPLWRFWVSPENTRRGRPQGFQSVLKCSKKSLSP